jgi:hypothetical protein
VLNDSDDDHPQNCPEYLAIKDLRAWLQAEENAL